MAAPSNLWHGGLGNTGHRPTTRDHLLSRGRARRIRRRFVRVGVDIPAARLREMAAGAAASPDELADVQFAMVAVETQREERRAKFSRTKRRGLNLLIVAALVVTSLNLLACGAYLFVSVVLHQSPF